MNVLPLAPFVLGYISQLFKARKGIQTWIPVAVTVAACLGLYLLQTPFDLHHWREWVLGAIDWSLKAIGTGSTASAFGLAPATDSKA